MRANKQFEHILILDKLVQISNLSVAKTTFRERKICQFFLKKKQIKKFEHTQTAIKTSFLLESEFTFSLNSKF